MRTRRREEIRIVEAPNRFHINIFGTTFQFRIICLYDILAASDFLLTVKTFIQNLSSRLLRLNSARF